MKARIRRKIHRQFERKFSVKPGYFMSDFKKGRNKIWRDLEAQMNCAYDYHMSRIYRGLYGMCYSENGRPG